MPIRGEKLSETTYLLPRLRVLCVDDNRDAADSAGLLLELYGCEVAVCYDAGSALTTALRFKPDLCLIDLNMPGMGGCELVVRIHEWSQNLSMRLIAVTAYGSDEARRETVAAGFDKHFVKPVDWDELVDILVKTARDLGLAAYISSRLEQFSNVHSPSPLGSGGRAADPSYKDDRPS